MLYETDNLTAEDIRFDRYIKGVIRNTVKEKIRQEIRLNSRKADFEDNEVVKVIENLKQEDEYNVEQSSVFYISENNRKYMITNELLYNAIRALKPIDRRIILMKQWDRFTDQKIADIVNMPRRTVNSRRSSIKRKIQRYMYEMRLEHNGD